MAEPDDTARLVMTGVGKRFGATVALANVDLHVRSGEVHALIGENGAGKSTLMKVLSGAISPDAGLMSLDGRAFAPRRPEDARAAGVAMIYQELTLAPHLTVEENVMLGIEQTRCGMLRRRPMRDRVCEALDRLGHPEILPDARVRDLSVGAQQLVEVARALVSHARIVVMDEPTSSLTREDTLALFDLIRRLRDRGVSIIYISHFLEEVREIAERFTVLRDGEAVGTAEVASTSTERIIEMMVGRNLSEMFPRPPRRELGEPVLELRGLSIRRPPAQKDRGQDVRATREDHGQDARATREDRGQEVRATREDHGQDARATVDLSLRRGEILGLFGLIGAGRSELARTVFGLLPATAGTIAVTRTSRPASIDGGARPDRRLAQGVGMVSEDRKDEGLALPMSIADNVTLSRLSTVSRFGLLSLRRQRQAAQRWIDQLEIRTTGPLQTIWNLSGGNQQKVAIARLLHQDADILLLDEPTRGIDVGAKIQIYRLIGELAAAGRAILFISSYLPELMGVCDRIGVMSRGRLVQTRPTSEWTEREIMVAATGAVE